MDGKIKSNPEGLSDGFYKVYINHNRGLFAQESIYAYWLLPDGLRLMYSRERGKLFGTDNSKVYTKDKECIVLDDEVDGKDGKVSSLFMDVIKQLHKFNKELGSPFYEREIMQLRGYLTDNTNDILDIELK